MRIIALILTLGLFTASAYAGSNANVVVTKMRSSHQGGRYYYSFGGVSMRLENTVVYPIQVTAPSISAGCSGIEVTGGGLHFMDSEQLGKIWEQMTDVNTWYAIGMGLAVKMLSNELGTEIENLQDLITKLNNMQFDTCAAMTAGATYLVDSGYRDKVNERASKAMKDLKEGKNNLFGDKDEKDETLGDHADYVEKQAPKLSSREYLKKNGSLLDYIFKEWLDNTSSTSTDTIKFPNDVDIKELRALYGDIQHKLEVAKDTDAGDSGNKVQEGYILISPCDKELSDYESHFYEKDNASACTATNARGFNDLVSTSMSDYAKFITDNQSVALDNKTTVTSVMQILSSYNITQLIEDSSGVGEQDYFRSTVEMCKPVSVTLVAYNYTDMFYDRLINTLRYMKNDVDEYGNEPGVEFSGAIDRLIKQAEKQHGAYSKSREGVYNIYADRLDAKRQEINDKLNKSTIKRTFTAERE
jgi:hypothetical protein